LAAHLEEFLDGLPEMSNCYCHPGKAGGWSFYIFQRLFWDLRVSVVILESVCLVYN
jgi:hypothetical protein